MKGALAEVIIFQVGIKGGVAGAVPKIIFILRPQFGGEQAAFIGVNLPETPDVVPLPDDEVRVEEHAVHAVRRPNRLVQMQLAKLML